MCANDTHFTTWATLNLQQMLKARFESKQTHVTVTNEENVLFLYFLLTADLICVLCLLFINYKIEFDINEFSKKLCSQLKIEFAE